MWGRVKEMRTIQFEFQKRILNFRKRFLKDPFQIFDFQNGAGSSLRSTIHVQGIFPIQGSNPGLLHCRQILYCLSHQRSPAAAAKSFQLCPTLRPHRWQPTRLPCPWDSPGKNTGVGCHFLLQCMKVKTESEDAQSYPTLSNPKDCSLPGSSIHGIFQAREALASPFYLNQKLFNPAFTILSDPGSTLSWPILFSHHLEFSTPFSWVS